MNKLLSAGFARMFKSKLFFLMAGLSAVSAMFIRLYVFFAGSNVDEAFPLDTGFFIIAAFIGTIMAIFCSLFVGTEYSDGTIRNKLIVGHSRCSVYLSNLILCAVAGMIFTLVFLLVSLVFGIPLSGFFKGTIPSVLFSTALSLLLAVAYSAIFVMIGMINQKKEVVAVIALLTAFVLLLAAVFIFSGLNEPEYYDSCSYTENGVTVFEETTPNPNYLQEGERKVYEFLFDFLPGCQGTRISQIHDPEGEPIFALYSLIIIGCTTSIGIIAFKKKNIK